MVLNKRDKDFGYKFMLSELGKSHKIQISIEGTVITFKLIEYYTIQGL
jgi:hypothetical protein